jgi:hypothetical protein
VNPTVAARTLGSAPERQKIFYEKILLKDYFFAGWCALRLEESSRRFWPFIPGKKWPHNRFHISDCLDPLGMALSP